MNDSATTHSRAPTRSIHASAATLVLDAVVFAVVAYKITELLLLGNEGVVERARAYPMAALLALVPPLFFHLQRRLGLAPSRERLVDQIVGLVLCTAPPVILALSPTSKGFSNAWLPLEWHKVPPNLLLMARISWPQAALGLVALLALGYALAARTRSGSGIFILALASWAAFNAYHVDHGLGSNKAAAYRIAFVVPCALGAALALVGLKRWAARLAAVGASGSLIFWHYVGVRPPRAATLDPAPPGFARFYPQGSAEPAFPLSHMRDYVITPDRRFLFTCYGPASGLARIELATGDTRIIEVHGLARYLWLDPTGSEILTMDWDSGDFLSFSTEPFAITRTVNILEGKRIAPWDFAVAGDRVYVTFHEHPILAEYDRATIQLLRELPFDEAGFTKFHAGLLKVAYDESSRMLYAELGMTDAGNRFLLVQVDPATMTVRQKAVLPEGGLDFVIIPSKRRIVAASFFSDRFYEFSTEPLELVRTFQGPLNSRNVIFDARRDLFYSLAFLPGELWALDYATAKPLARLDIGGKAQSLMLDVERDQLYFGSAQGGYRVELTKWMADRPPH